MDKLELYIQYIISKNSLDVESDSYEEEVYEALSELDLNELEESRFEEVIHNLHHLCQNEKLSKYYVYLSCLANKNRSVLQRFVECDKASANLSAISQTEIFEYVVYKRKHWFLKVLKEFNNLGQQYFSNDIYQKVLIAELIRVTNSANISTDKVRCILDALHSTDDRLIEFYKNEVREATNVLTFMYNLNVTDIEVDEAFNFVIRNSLLTSLSKYVTFERIKNWKSIENKLHQFEHLDDGAEVDVFISFTVIYTILNFITLRNKCSGAICNLEKTKQNFFRISRVTLQLEVIKTLFIIMFLREEHLKDGARHEGQEYANDSESLHTILQFLKDIFETIKIQNKYDKESPEYQTFTDFNKHLMDAIWRYDLITQVKSSKLATAPRHLLSYMLAPPESLVHLCLKTGDFERAQQVVKIFNLEETYLAKEIDYSASLADLKELYKKKQNREDVMEFFQNSAPVYEESSEKDLIPACLQKENQRFMNLFDFAITQCSTYEDSKALLDEAFKHWTCEDDDVHYAKFCNKFKALFYCIGEKKNISARNVLLSSNFTLDKDQYQKDDDFFEQLATLYHKFEDDLTADANGAMNSIHESHSSFAKLRELCERSVEVPLVSESRSYLGRLFTYLKAFSKVLYIQQNNSGIVSKGRNCSFFEILQHNRALVVGKLLFENNLDPADFEEAFAKLKLDLLYHIAGNCFPTINLHKQEVVSSEELYPENRLYVPTSSIMTYVQKRHWLLAYILSEMYKVHALNVDVNRSRIRHFANHMGLPRIQHLKVLFEGSELITALQNEIDADKLTAYIQKRMESDAAELASSCSSEESVESAQEMSEEHLRAVDWKYLFDIVDSIPEYQMRRSEDYQNLRDLILKSMVSELYEFNYYEYVQHISNGRLRIETILGSFDTWPVDFCIKLLTSELSRLEGSSFERKVLAGWIEKLELYKLIMEFTQQEKWYEIHKICHEDPAEMLKQIISTKKIDTLLQFLNVFGPALDNLGQFITATYLAEILEQNEPFTKAENVLDLLPSDVVTPLCYQLLKLLKSINHHQDVVDYLLKIMGDENEVLKNLQISLKILSNFSQDERDQLSCLIISPLEILEVLVMNTKLDKLGLVLESIRADLKKNEDKDDVINTHSLDEILRCYAEKSLDFRVVLHSAPAKSGEHKLLESFDSGSLNPERRKFVMPTKVPSKEEWVANNEVTVCMCCSQSTFSMFNRRHHCRRCGRVVCYSCSQKRMLVETYEDILVRVCDNCFEQTQSSVSSSKAGSSSSKSLMYDYWLLTEDEEHNVIVREEFSYEHAPSVSLCLSILKHHSKTTEYPQFLLKQCENMLKLLHPKSEATNEIDHLLVIRMLKSLTLAAKMSCSECMLHWGISLADRILSQADLLSLLIERGCLNLLPVSGQSEGTFIDTSVLRKLRDKLLEDEQWNLALEVSTKTGLDSTGVFAAWGKTCLKAGSLQLAREKFQRCFLKTSYEASSDLEGSFSVGRRSRNSNSSGESRLRDPPLLNEIIQILETKTVPINKKVLKKMEDTKHLSSSTFSLNQSLVGFAIPSDPAICILNKLKNLDAIAAGNYYEEEEDEVKSCSFKPRIQPIFYEECTFYLQKYGTPLSLLQFFIRHADYREALKYVLEMKVSAEVFTEVYITCLKDGIVDRLHAYMREIDPSLDTWKEYFMHICRTLEKQNRLHSLYQLQLFIGDCIRAAVTCIKFYKENARSFSELVDRENYLQQAEMHLNQDLEQQQWVEVAAVSRSVCSIESFEEKSITNPSLVMKMSSKSIGRHINTIWRQMELARFLAGCEAAGRVKADSLTEILPHQEGEDPKVQQQPPSIPTLFDSLYEKIRLVGLTIISGEAISQGFEFAQKLMTEFKLKPMKVYCLVGKQLAKTERYPSIAELVTCIRVSNNDEKSVNEMCDEMLSFAVRTMTNADAPASEVEALIKLINDKGTKISAYIEAKQLKSAYFLAVKYKRMPDIRRIMREAELLNQPSIKSLCHKFIQSHSHSGTSP